MWMKEGMVQHFGRTSARLKNVREAQKEERKKTKQLPSNKKAIDTCFLLRMPTWPSTFSRIYSKSGVPRNYVQMCITF